MGGRMLPELFFDSWSDSPTVLCTGGTQSVLQKLNRVRAAKAVQAVAPHVDGTPPDQKTAEVFVQDLPFFPGHQLLEIREPACMPPGRWCAVWDEATGEAEILDGAPAHIYALAGRVNLALSAKSVGPYLRFFCAFARGPQGRFCLVEGPQELDWMSDSTMTAREEIADLLSPLELGPQDPDGTWHLFGCFVLARSLFRAQVTVTLDGVVSITREATLAENLPVGDDALEDMG